MKYILWIIATLFLIAFAWYFVVPFLYNKYLSYKVYKLIKKVSDAHKDDVKLKEAVELAKKIYEETKMFDND